MQWTLRVAHTLSEVDSERWRSLAGSHPFCSPEFLGLLETTGCASRKTGWRPYYLLLERAGELRACAATYLKSHSRGEFVFDQGWAQAFESHGLAYYPKLVLSVPFTPVTGPRLLAIDDEARLALAQGLVTFAEELGVSSLHVLFPNEQDRQVLETAGFMIREQVQFHWSNRAGLPYVDLDDFLAGMSHDKRKKLKQDRKHVMQAGIGFRWLTGESLTPADLEFFYACYTKTYEEHWSAPYLSFEFFEKLHAARPDLLMLVLAHRDGAPVACAMNVMGDQVLYGRYWGSTEFVSGLHFETCYLQSIEFCISRGFQTFEGGAQGEHKMARGLLPVRTTSAHWIADRRFAEAIADFLNREGAAVEAYAEQLQNSSPFKQSPEQPPPAVPSGQI